MARRRNVVLPWPSHQSKGRGYANLGIPISIVQFGAIGDGIADDTLVFQNAGTSGEVVALEAGMTYRVTSAIDVVDGGGFVGPRSAVVYADPAAFDNINPDINHRYGDNAYVFRVDNGAITPNTTSHAIFTGFTIKGGEGDATTDGRVVGAIFLRNVGWVEIDGLEIWGFPVGKGVCLTACYGGHVSRCRIHDFYENTLFGLGAGTYQLTGIEVDNDIIAGNTIGSKGLRFVDNDIYNLTVGAAFLAADGDQTDGINLCSLSSLDPDSGHFTVVSNRIHNIAEGVDNFSDHAIITDNEISDMYAFGIKMTHGASYCKVIGNDIRRVGFNGIGVSSSDGNHDTSHNIIVGNTITTIDPDGDWVGADFSACIQLLKAGAFDLKSNIIAYNDCDPGVNGKYSIVRAAGATGTLNDYIYNKAKAGTVATYSATAETGALLTVGSLSFPAVFVSSADAYTLDDYREVAWTPALGATGTAPTGATYSAAVAFYTKIGRYFHAWGRMICTSKGSGGTGNATLTGFPLVVVGSQHVGPQRATGYTPLAGSYLCGTLVTSTVFFEEWVGAGVADLTWANVSNTFDILFDFSGMTAT